MLKFILIVVSTLSLTNSYSEAVTCYHCYDSFNLAPVVGRANGSDFGDKFVRCDKNQKNWNTWNCPAKWPVCILMYGKVFNHYEVVRTCGEKYFCLKYIPPPGVKVTSCKECNTTMCNDYERINPPEKPDPLFVFNINIDLKVNKYTLVGSEDKK